MTPASKPAHWQALAIMLALIAATVTALLRVFPLEWNLTAMGALALFGGARIRSWPAYALPLLLLVLTDALLAHLRGHPFPHFTMPFVYGSFLLIVLLGRSLFHSENPLRIGLTAIAGSVLFFLVTNFASWIDLAFIDTASPYSYEPTLAGLLTCYEMGLPFYRGTFTGDAVFTAALFSAYALAIRASTATSVERLAQE
jgi:hypothetical protein